VVKGIGDVEHPKWTMEGKRAIQHKAVELRNALRREFGTLVALDPPAEHYIEDEAPPGPIYAEPRLPLGVLGSGSYEEETLDEEELESGKLKKATEEDKLNRAVKRTKVSMAEPEEQKANAGNEARAAKGL
jgi:hypothetical protein